MGRKKIGRRSKRGEGEKVLHVLVQFPNGHNCQGWIRSLKRHLGLPYGWWSHVGERLLTELFQHCMARTGERKAAYYKAGRNQTWRRMPG